MRNKGKWDRDRDVRISRNISFDEIETETWEIKGNEIKRETRISRNISFDEVEIETWEI